MSQAVEASQGKTGFSRSRLFRWGIGFWIVVWILSVCFFQKFELSIKGCRELTLFVLMGTVGCEVSNTTATSTHLGVPVQAFIFKGQILNEFRQNYGILGMLANGGWYRRSSGISVGFPTSGLLCIWLAIGLVAEIRLGRLARTEVGGQFLDIPYSPRRLVSLAVLMLSLAATTSYLVIRSRAAEEKRGCWMAVRNIQIAMRSWAGMNGPGKGVLIPWSKIIGKGSFVDPQHAHCPSGSDYELSPVVPDVGELAAKCPHPEHQNFDHHDW